MHQIDELATCHVPYSAGEYRWARQRPVADRTPIPSVGDEVLYRHAPWEPPVPADVLHVQPFEDMADPNLWSDIDGPEGMPIWVPAVDPWPLLTLRAHGYGRVKTREARLRGSPGWLPLDWQSRKRT